jgi:hypothetical protein
MREKKKRRSRSFSLLLSLWLRPFFCAKLQKFPRRDAARLLHLLEAVGYVGRLGGHLGRKVDGFSGVRTLWSGLQDLQIAVRYAQSLLPP